MDVAEIKQKIQKEADYNVSTLRGTVQIAQGKSHVLVVNSDQGIALYALYGVAGLDLILNRYYVTVKKPCSK